MGFEITNDPDPEMFQGQIITYTVKPVLGIKQKLIKIYVKPN